MGSTSSRFKNKNHTKSILPFDVLAQMFEAYTASLRLDHPDFSNAAIPWVLGQVCHSWRQVATSVPRCWNRFTLMVTDEGANKELPEKFAELIKRSGNVPFGVSFDFAPFSDEISPHPYRILEPLIRHSSQWEAIMMNGLDVTDVSNQFGQIKGRLDHLRSMKIYFRSSMSRSSIPNRGDLRRRERDALPAFDLFGAAPSLSYVFFNDMTGHLMRYKPVLPWSQLKAYVVYGSKNDIFPSELRRQSNLETFICMHNRFPPPSPEQSHVIHHHLRHLHLHFSRDMEACIQRLGEVSLPALETISITLLSSEAYYSTSSIPGIAALVSRSKCQLKTLVVLQISTLNVDLFPNLLSELPSLETLDIGNGLHFDSVLPLLVFDKDKKTLLPNLRRLAVSFSAFVRPKDVQLISNIIESRQRVSNSAGDLGQLFSPLLYARIFIKSSGVLDSVFQALDGWPLPSPPARDPDTSYLPTSTSVETFHHQMNTALDNIQRMIESKVPISASDSDKIAAEIHFAKRLYYSRALASSSAYIGSSERKLLEILRSLCKVYVPPAYLGGRKWLWGTPSNLLYIHPEHALRTSSHKSDIIAGVDYPGKYPLEGYHDWFDEHSNRMLETIRSFTL